jgi:hypothetical protein
MGQEQRTTMNISNSGSGSERGEPLLPLGASIFSRKVARSGHISYEGRPYFISKALAGRYIRLVVIADRLIVDAAIPLHKEYSLTSHGV